MKVGEYVRNKYGIAKVIDIKNNNGIDILIFDKPICFLVNKETGKIKEDKLFNQLALIDDIDLSKVKHSQNIIDLIEIGDYVDKLRVVDKEDNYIVVETFDERIIITKEDNIKLILTKEQFESMEYKVGE